MDFEEITYKLKQTPTDTLGAYACILLGIILLVAGILLWPGLF